VETSHPMKKRQRWKKGPCQGTRICLPRGNQATLALSFWVSCGDEHPTRRERKIKGIAPVGRKGGFLGKGRLLDDTSSLHLSSHNKTSGNPAKQLGRLEKNSVPDQPENAAICWDQRAQEMRGREGKITKNSYLRVNTTGISERGNAKRGVEGKNILKEEDIMSPPLFLNSPPKVAQKGLEDFGTGNRGERTTSNHLRKRRDFLKTRGTW